jgi:hypothetical protein
MRTLAIQGHLQKRLIGNLDRGFAGGWKSNRQLWGEATESAIKSNISQKSVQCSERKCRTLSSTRDFVTVTLAERTNDGMEWESAVVGDGG